MLKPAIVVLLLFLVPWALHWVRLRVGAYARYVGVVGGGLLLLLGLLQVPATFLAEVPTAGFTLAVTVALLPPLALLYSLQALTTASGIPFWISIPGLVLSVIGTLYLFTLIMISGAGYMVG